MKLFITGYHHSGTSFLTDIVDRLGVSVGAARELKPGYLEHPDLMKVDDELVGKNWAEPDYSEAGVLPFPANYVFPDAYKNPRLMVTAPFWQKLFPEAKWIKIHRSTYDVCQSMMRDGKRIQSVEYWGKSVIEYEKCFKSFCESYNPKILELEYWQLCFNPDVEILKIGKFLDIRKEKIDEVIKWVKENVKYKTYE